jgi:hypothetical protein
MSDYETIQSLFSSNPKLPKYSHKRWVKIHPTNNNYADTGNGLTQAINYNCRNVSDKLINYQDGYLLIKCRATRAALDNRPFAPKNSSALVEQCIIRLNGQELDNTRYNYVFVDMLNALEYSHDYSKIEEGNTYALNTNMTVANNLGHTTRKLLIPEADNNQLDYSIKLPFTYLSTFFRALDFPILNNEIELDITYRLGNSIVRDVNADGAITVAIRSTVMYLPIVELPTEYESKLLKTISDGFSKELVWNRLTNRIYRTENNAINKEIEPSINGIRKLYFVAVPVAKWGNQNHTESTSNTTLTNCNIVIDSEDFYPQDILTDEELYQLTSELFNMQGKDPNTGALLSFSNFKNVNRYYCFDLSRQKVFESDPRKAQSIRFKGTINQQSHLLFFLAQEKRTSIDMKNPYNTSTV